MSAVSHSFQAEVSQVLRLVIHSLYSNQEIFLRELLSNSSDALDKRRFSALQAPELWNADEPLKVRLIPDKEQGTLTIWDNGIGMGEEELKQSLGTIAWSGSREFLKKLEGQSAEARDLPQLIGQFGVGFYSSFLVAERVEVISRAAGSEKAHRWESTGEG
ncbi:MAG TPA: ATP-binding protein, partial [Polyangiaceae bacterium]|nr:ATP-binding protein [Polyangiaceae bacterium]